MIHPLRNNNFADQNVPAVNLAKQVREVKGNKCRGNELEEIVAGANEVEYEVGDMVWAKIKSYPWWPGHIFKEDWAVPSVLKTKKEGQVLVAFFGDNSYGWFDPKELKPFDPHYVEKSKQSKLPAFLDAVEDAEDEVSRRAALGLACWCHNLVSMRPINYFDWFYAVDIKGHDSSGVYSMKQIKRARNEFQPVVALSLFRQLALIPGGKVQRDVAWVKNVRKAVFEEIDETRVLSYGDQSENYNYSTIDLGQLQKEVPFQVPQSRPIEVSEAVGQTKKSASSVELTNQLERETCTSKQYEKGECTSCDRKVESQGSKTHQYEILKDGTDESFKINSIEESGQIISCDKGNSLTSQPQKENKANHTLSSDSMDDMQVLGSVRTEAELFPVRSPLSARALSLPLDSIPPKKRIKLDGYPMTCQQSSIHDDREEIPQRVQRGVNKSKAVAAEEKARNQVDIKSRNRNQEKRDSVHVVNEVKHLPKKPETCVKIEKPTFLIVRFPSKSALSSLSELKAKFVRFGPLDLSATHVSWKSSTCIVAFKCKSDALAAYDYATQNKFLFGNANVHYQLQASEIPPYNHKYLEISL